jgi:hypothetical protein
VRWPPAWEFVNWSNSSLVGYSPGSSDMSTDAEESPLLSSVAGKRLMKAD